MFSRNNIRYFFYIGGNDSADTARIVNDLAAQAKYELRVFHIPKTIDNDLRVTDHCPGYGSAAKFVACALIGDDRDNASLPGVKSRRDHGPQRRLAHRCQRAGPPG